MSRFFQFQTLLVTCSAIAFSGAAHAQDQGPAGAESADSEIVVTAQRREERLQDVPIAMSVVSAEQLADSNFTTIADLQFLSPGVNFNSNFGGGFNLRGIGTQSLLMTAEQSVGLVIDDVVQGLPEVSFAGPSYQTLSDIERVEVLRGPQGTLFGKNSSAGVVQVITARPELGFTGGNASASYGSNNEVNISGAFNMPIGDRMAIRITPNYQSRDGFVENRFTGNDIWGYDRSGVRTKLLWEPTDALSILFTNEFRRLVDDANGEWTLRSCGSGFGAFNPCSTLAPYGVVASPENLAGAWDGNNRTRQILTTNSLRFDYEFGNATLTAITAFRDLKQDIAVDTDGTPRPIYSYNRNISGGDQFTQEFRISGGAGPIQYTAGAFYYNAQPYQVGMNGGTLGLVPDSSPVLISTTAIGPSSGSGYSVRVDAEVESWAAFGQIEASVTDQLTLIAGGRFTSDEVTQAISYFDTGMFCRAAWASGGTCHPTPTPPAPTTAATSAEEFTYRLAARYELTPDINIYGSYATGYKGPMISYPANQPQQLVRPELSESWEIGVKSQWFDRALTVNVDLFSVEYEDFQGQQRVGTPPIFYYTTTNAGGLKTHGVEADILWRATDNLNIGASFAYIPTEFTEFSVQCFDLYANPATTPGQCTYVAPGLPPGSPAQFNAAGYPLIYAPEWTYSIRADYTVPLSNNNSIDISANWNWRDETYGVVADPNSINPSYGLLNGQIGYSHDDGRWRISLFGRNLLDEHYVAGIFRTPLDAGASNTTPRSTIGYSNIPAMDSSRTIGVKLDVEFGN
jgi:iron complex outermembrane receptor protein